MTESPAETISRLRLEWLDAALAHGAFSTEEIATWHAYCEAKKRLAEY